jgi:glycosyl-4,4'-diaponeurosporenoate acyltransferase
VTGYGLPQIAAWSLVWLAFGLASGWIIHRWPLRAFTQDGPVTRLRRWEREGAVYRRIGVHRWKDLLPEAGDFFPGGVSKRRLPDASPATLGRFEAETRRAEHVHWINAWFGPTFFLWTPWQVGMTMTAFGFGAHLPFVIIQRYNRGRVQRVRRRSDLARRRKGSPTPT